MCAARINIDKPRWDQSTFSGRLKHFFAITNPLNLLKSSSELENSKKIVTRYRNGENLNISEDELWKAKNIYDSAFHPETGEKMIIIGRMSTQVPMNMFITGAMLSFYKSKAAVIFWQWFNQSYNAIVNYSNRSGDKPIEPVKLLGIYVSATSAALATAISFNHFTKKSPPLIRRWVPFIAVCAANAVNIPMVRMGELQEGTILYDENEKEIGHSQKTARVGISKVIMSRIAMAVPTMVGLPILMDNLEKKGILTRYPKFGTPFQIFMCGFILTFATPIGCALFPQRSSIAVSKLEPELQERIKRLPNSPKILFYNKGL